MFLIQQQLHGISFDVMFFEGCWSSQPPSPTKLFCLSCTHLRFLQMNLILAFSSYVPKLSKFLCWKHCTFQFSGSINCAPFWAWQNTCFSSGIGTGCTVICIYLNLQHETHLQITQMCFSIDNRGPMMIHVMISHALTLLSSKKL